MMTYEEVIAFASAHYNDGGDAIVECLGREDYEYEIANNDWCPTEETLLEEFRLCKLLFEDQAECFD